MAELAHDDRAQVAGSVRRDVRLAIHDPLPPARGVRGSARERAARRQRIALLPRVRVVGGVPGQAVQRQAEAHRRIAGQEEHVLLPQEPAAALPARRRAVAVDRADRQRVADDLAQAALEDSRQPLPLLLVLEVRLQRIDVGRQPPLFPEVVPGVFVARHRCRRARTPAVRPDAG